MHVFVCEPDASFECTRTHVCVSCHHLHLCRVLAWLLGHRDSELTWLNPSEFFFDVEFDTQEDRGVCSEGVCCAVRAVRACCLHFPTAASWNEVELHELEVLLSYLLLVLALALGTSKLATSCTSVIFVNQQTQIPGDT